MQIIIMHMIDIDFDSKQNSRLPHCVNNEQLIEKMHYDREIFNLKQKFKKRRKTIPNSIHKKNAVKNYRFGSKFSKTV
ncbi:hypothetical protein [Vallitalea guaymasensis]|uniref:hypothetical protein n=1 Tax=Vallitalea guaymasensis TaxID=1185412 RepID=UPI000DE3CDAA|nr:hypothetical protein [Vallitalea guaymasensis]